MARERAPSAIVSRYQMCMLHQPVGSVVCYLIATSPADLAHAPSDSCLSIFVSPISDPGYNVFLAKLALSMAPCCVLFNSLGRCCTSSLFALMINSWLICLLLQATLNFASLTLITAAKMGLASI